MNLVDPGTLKAFLARHGVTATKGLGQHFLCSRSAVDSIVAALSGYPGILEIGPGPGVLTSPLSSRSALTAIELDPRMVAALAESAPTAQVVQADALKADLEAILAGLPAPRAVVSNLPYYITGPLLGRITDAAPLWERAVLMMQREVGQKILAKPGHRDRGALSVSMQTRFDIVKVADVPPGCFLPPPKVESIVLQFTPRPSEDDEAYFRLLRFGFSQPRKTLANNLAAGLRVSRDQAIEALESLGLDERVRPQELEIDAWRALRRILA